MTFASEQASAPSLALFQGDQPTERLIRSAAARLNQTRVPLTRLQRQQLLDKLFADQIGALVYISCAKNLGLDVSMAQREELVRREAFRGHEPDRLHALTAQILALEVSPNELAGGPRPPEHQFGVFDLDRDGHADLVLVPKSYFGPSAGWAFYVRHRGTFKHLYDNSGEILRVESTPARTVLRFMMTIIDPGEPVILVSLLYDHKAGAWSAWKQYYAARTTFPKAFSRPSAFTTASEVSLRLGPALTDAKTERLVKEEQTTKTLAGNMVARYRAGAQGYALGVQGEWAFVAFTPKTPPIESSLRHDLDREDGHWKDGVFTKGRDVEPYLCGWIPRSALK